MPRFGPGLGAGLFLLLLAANRGSKGGGKGSGGGGGTDTGGGFPIDPNPRSDHGWFEGYPYGIEPMAGGGYAVVVVVGGTIGPDPSAPQDFDQIERSVATWEDAQQEVAAITSGRGQAPAGLPWPPWWPENPG